MHWRFSIRSLLIATAVTAIVVLVVKQTQLATYVLLRMGWIPEVQVLNEQIFFDGETYYVLNTDLSDKLPGGFRLATRRKKDVQYGDGLFVFADGEAGLRICDLDLQGGEIACFRDITGDGQDELILGGRDDVPQSTEEVFDLSTKLDSADAYGQSIPVWELEEYYIDVKETRVYSFDNGQVTLLFSYPSGRFGVGFATSWGRVAHAGFVWADLFGDGTPVCCYVEEYISEPAAKDGWHVSRVNHRLASYYQQDVETKLWSESACEVLIPPEGGLDGLLKGGIDDRLSPLAPRK